MRQATIPYFQAFIMGSFREIEFDVNLATPTLGLSGKKIVALHDS